MNKIKAIKRLLRIRKIRKEYNKKVSAEVSLLKKCVAYMNEWQDIPMSQLLPSMCKTMNIQRSKAAREMFTFLCVKSSQEHLEYYAKLLVKARANYDIRYEE